MRASRREAFKKQKDEVFETAKSPFGPEVQWLRDKDEKKTSSYLESVFDCSELRI